MRGISPLIAVIMLVAFALIVSGIVISWGIGFTESKRSEVQLCSKAQILLERAYYNQNTGNINLVVHNTGKVPLTGFTVLISYTNGTVTSSGNQYKDYEIQPDDISIFPTDFGAGLKEAVVQSKQCKGAQDMVIVYDIQGL
jgi:flagellin-like protein